jgi:hypothetical protein
VVAKCQVLIAVEARNYVERRPSPSAGEWPVMLKPLLAKLLGLLET